MPPILTRYGPAALSGIILALSFPTWHLYPLAWAGLFPLLAHTWWSTPGTAFKKFLVAGFLFHLVLLQWLLSNMYWAGGWAVWGYVGLCLYLAIFWGATGAIWRLAVPALPWAPPWIVLAILWYAMETIQSFLFTGFCWGALGYAQGPDLWLSQWASIGGVALISGILVVVNAMAAHAFHARALRLPLMAGAIGVVVLTHAAGAFLVEEAEYDVEPYTVGLVQPDFPLEMKWDREYTVEMVRITAEKSRQLVTSAGPVDLLVWPEALIMGDLDEPGMLTELQTVVQDLSCTLYTGAHRSNLDTGDSFNSSFVLDPEGNITEHYDKVHLAPFGEYVPLSQFVPFISKVVPAIGDIEHGAIQKTLAVDGKTLGPLICFEVLFPGMAEWHRTNGADVLVVITNLAWFGSSNAIPQEREIARMRAIETRLPLIHSANTGYSGVFDPWGRFEDVDWYMASTGAFERTDIPASAKLGHRFAGRFAVASPGTRLMPFGTVYGPRLAMLLAALVLAAGLWHRFGPGMPNESAQQGPDTPRK